MSGIELFLGVVGVIFGAINTALAIHREDWSAARGWFSAFVMTLAWISK